MRSKNFWILLILLLSGIVLGGFLGSLAEGISWLSWLNFGQSFGLNSPLVLDFGVLKRIVSEEIVSHFDHALVLRASESGEEFFRVLAERFGNVVTVGYQPTCENMLGDFAARIAARLPEGVALHSLRLHETATSFAEWFAEDNM